MKFSTHKVFAIVMFFSVLLFAAGFKHGETEGIKTGKLQAENKPFAELVRMIKESKSVFVVGKKDVAYLEDTGAATYLQGGK